MSPRPVSLLAAHRQVGGGLERRRAQTARMAGFSEPEESTLEASLGVGKQPCSM